MKTRNGIHWVFALTLLVWACGDESGEAASGAGSGASSGSGAGPGSGGSGGGGTGGGGGGGMPLPCGSFPTFEAGKSPTTAIHVAESGSDGSGDGSAGAPYASLERAVADAGPGSAVVVHAGTYAGGAFISGLAGTDEAPIWIGGAAGEALPVISGGANGIQLSNVRYLVIHDLEITGATANGINTDDGGNYADPDATRYIVFRGLDIHDIGSSGNQDCLKLSGVDDFWVLGSRFVACGGGMSGSGIDHVGCHDGMIAGNYFANTSGNGVQCKGGSRDIDIRANHFDNAGERAVNMGGSTGFEFFRPPLNSTQPNAEARNIRVIANVIEGSTAALGFVGCVGCLAANNTIVDPGRWVFRILQETVSGGGYTFEPARDGVVVNNLVFFGSGGSFSTHVNVGADTAPDTFSFQTNLWFNHASPGASAPDLPVTEEGGIVGEDPLLADPSGGDFAIPAGSPAAGAGSDVSALAGDFVGACYASPPSIGAFEAP